MSKKARETGPEGTTAALHQKLKGDATPSSEDVSDVLPPEALSPDVMRERLIEAEEKAASFYDRLLRLQADMGNMQRRVERDVMNAHKFALEKFVLELLPVIDSLERALAAHAEDASGAGTLLDGVNLTLKMFLAAFEKFGVQQVDPVGAAFNPDHHEAVSMQVDPSVPAGTVLSVLQKGYLLNDRLVRPALVIVAKGS